MATKSPDAEAAAPPAKSKKLFLLVLIALVVLALLAAGGWIYLANKQAQALDDEDEDGDEAVAVVVKEPQGPPTYLPLDNMVVNLADPGGERVAQIGVTLELYSAPDTDKVKAYLPSIRSEILLLISQRTAEEVLSREGKDRLAADILMESSKHFAMTADNAKNKKGAKAEEKPGPIRRVLFASFIVQ